MEQNQKDEQKRFEQWYLYMEGQKNNSLKMKSKEENIHQISENQINTP